MGRATEILGYKIESQASYKTYVVAIYKSVNGTSPVYIGSLTNSGEVIAHIANDDREVVSDIMTTFHNKSGLAGYQNIVAKQAGADIVEKIMRIQSDVYNDMNVSGFSPSDYNEGGLRGKVVQEIAARVLPYINEVTQEDIDALEDENFHCAVDAILMGKNTKSSSTGNNAADTFLTLFGSEIDEKTDNATVSDETDVETDEAPLGDIGGDDKLEAEEVEDETEDDEDEETREAMLNVYYRKLR